MASSCSSSVKTYVPTAEVALVIRSDRNRCVGDFVVVARCMNGCKAARLLTYV